MQMLKPIPYHTKRPCLCHECVTEAFYATNRGAKQGGPLSLGHTKARHFLEHGIHGRGVTADNFCFLQIEL